MRSLPERLRSRCIGPSIRSGTRPGVLITAVLIAAGGVGLGGCRDDDGDAPVTPPPGGTTGTTATTIDPNVAAGANGAPGTGLISIDGPATVDSSFGAATPAEGGG